MVSTGFLICLVTSAIVTVYLAQKTTGKIDKYYWTISLLLPFIILGYFLKTQFGSAEVALLLYFLIDLFTSILLVVILFSLLHEMKVDVRGWLKGTLYGAVLVYMLISWMTVTAENARNVVRVVDTGDGYATLMLAKMSKFVLPQYVVAILVAAVCIIAICISSKKLYSRLMPVVYLALVGTGIAICLIEALVKSNFSVLPYLFMFGDIVIVLNYDHARSHDITSLIGEQQDEKNARGYVAISLSGWFLSCNEKSCEFLPDLKKQRVDEGFPENSELSLLLYGLIEDYKNDGKASTKFRSGEKTCEAAVSVFSAQKNGAPQGYLIDIQDITQEQKNLEIMATYTEKLNEEVAEKTLNIREIQRKIVLSMADMIENRDSNTGGHVKRTSDVIRILVKEIQAQGCYNLTSQFAKDIIRSAPMHDLGKISVDSSILNKPARLTPEEYEIMKTHSTTSGQMVKILLDGVEEEKFVKTAYQLARFHHERWDGRGYPEGLVGEMIPVEARIMAVADVYDALVSKRVYKEPMSYEKAAIIMHEGMGTQFDPNMRTIFTACREKLEEYYSNA